MDDIFDALNAMDREAIMRRFAEEMPGLRKELDVTLADLSEKTGMDEKKLKDVEAGKRTMKWSEFMSILFIFWNNDVGRKFVESKGLFPEALKRAMSLNRNAHAPVTESSRMGF